MNGKRAIKKSSRNNPVKKSLRLVKAKVRKLHLKEHKN